jgi:hypothetical protein
MAKGALKGNVQAFAGLTDRIEGKVTNKMEMDTPGDDNPSDRTERSPHAKKQYSDE